MVWLWKFRTNTINRVGTHIEDSKYCGMVNIVQSSLSGRLDFVSELEALSLQVQWNCNLVRWNGNWTNLAPDRIGLLWQIGLDLIFLGVDPFFWKRRKPIREARERLRRNTKLEYFQNSRLILVQNDAFGLALFTSWCSHDYKQLNLIMS